MQNCNVYIRTGSGYTNENFPALSLEAGSGFQGGGVKLNSGDSLDAASSGGSYELSLIIVLLSLPTYFLYASSASSLKPSPIICYSISKMYLEFFKSQLYYI